MKVNINSAYFPLSTLRKYTPKKRDDNICTVKHYQDINNSYNIEMPDNFHIPHLNYNPRTKVSRYIENLKTSESILNDASTFINSIKKIDDIKSNRNLYQKFKSNSKEVQVLSFGDIDLKEKTSRLKNYNYENKVEIKELNKAIDNYNNLENKCKKLPYKVKKFVFEESIKEKENNLVDSENHKPTSNNVIKFGEKNTLNPKRGKNLNFKNVNIVEGVFGHLKHDQKKKLSEIKNSSDQIQNCVLHTINGSEKINSESKKVSVLRNMPLINENKDYFDFHPKQSAYLKNLNDFSIKEADYLKNENEIVLKKKPILNYDCIEHKSKYIDNLCISTPTVNKYQKK